MRIPFFSLSVTILVLSFENSHSKCHLCGIENGVIQNPDAPIPLLKIPGPIPTTCQVAYNYAQIIEDGDPSCALLQQQAVYCQCSNVVAVVSDQACDLCNGESDQNDVFVLKRLIIATHRCHRDRRREPSTVCRSKDSIW